MGVSSEKDTPFLYIWASYFSCYKKVGKCCLLYTSDAADEL